MSWSAVIFGSFSFPAGRAAAWRDSHARITRADWPSMLAPTDDANGAAHATVGDILDEIDAWNQDALGVGPYFLHVLTEGDGVRVRGHLHEDDYREILEKIVGLLSAAAASGAEGRLQVRNAGALSGGSVELRGGAIVGADVGPRLDPDDEAEMRAILAHAGAKGAKAAPLSRDAKRRIAAREKTRARRAAKGAKKSEPKKKVAKKKATPKRRAPPKQAAAKKVRPRAPARKRRR